MLGNGYYGTGRGRILGPYADEEIGARLRAQQTLGHPDVVVYFTRARSFEEAKRKIYREASRNNER